MTPQVLVMGALVIALATEAAPTVGVLTAVCAAVTLVYPAAARRMRANRG